MDVRRTIRTLSTLLAGLALATAVPLAAQDRLRKVDAQVHEVDASVHAEVNSEVNATVGERGEYPAAQRQAQPPASRFGMVRQPPASRATVGTKPANAPYRGASHPAAETASAAKQPQDARTKFSEGINRRDHLASAGGAKLAHAPAVATAPTAPASPLARAASSRREKLGIAHTSHRPLTRKKPAAPVPGKANAPMKADPTKTQNDELKKKKLPDELPAQVR